MYTIKSRYIVISMHMNQKKLHKRQKGPMGHKSAIPNTMRSYLGLIERFTAVGHTIKGRYIVISMHMNQRELRKRQKGPMGHKSAIPNTMRSYLGLIETICSSCIYNQGSIW